jgi:hypothetical protein
MSRLMGRYWYLLLLQERIVRAALGNDALAQNHNHVASLNC